MKTGKIYVMYLVQLVLIGTFVMILLGYGIRTKEKDYFENEMFSEAVKGLRMSDPRLDEEVDFTPPLIPDEKYMTPRLRRSAAVPSG